MNLLKLIFYAVIHVKFSFYSLLDYYDHDNTNNISDNRPYYKYSSKDNDSGDYIAVL